MELILSERKPFTLTLITRPNRKSASHFIPESIVPNIVESFFDVKKHDHYMLSPVKTFYNGLGKPEEMIISRLSISET